MPRVLANNEHPTFSANQLALLTDWFDAWSHLHSDPSSQPANTLAYRTLPDASYNTPPRPLPWSHETGWACHLDLVTRNSAPNDCSLAIAHRSNHSLATMTANHHSHRTSCSTTTKLTAVPRSSYLLVSIGDTTPSEIVRGELYLYLVSGQNPNSMHPHLPRAMGQNLETILELDAEHRVRKWLHHCPFKDDRVLFSLCQFILLPITLIDCLFSTHQPGTTLKPRPFDREAQKATLLV
jgi:hypothetical protein